MSTLPTPPATSRSSARALLALDRDELRLSSPRGEVASGAITLSNRGEASLDGTVAPRVGAEWLRVEPAVLRLAPGESRRLEVRADPATLSSGYTLGELEVVSSGGDAIVAVRIGVRTGRSWGLFAAVIALCAVVAVTLGVLLAGVKLPALAPAASAPAKVSHTTHTKPAHASLPAFNRQAALAGIRAAIMRSNAAWQAALTNPAGANLGAIKAGSDLAANTAEVKELLSGQEHWRISSHGFTLLAVGVSAGGASGWGTARKIERRALYGRAGGRPYDVSDDAYTLRYSLVRKQGRWLVDDVAVRAITPLAVNAGPDLNVQQVAALVEPAVVHVEADGGAGGAVGTGIVIRSSATASYIVTNNHVVAGANVVKIQRWRNGRYEPANPWIATQVRTDAANDLAVIRIGHGNMPTATWGDSNALQAGQAVVAIGYAENLFGGPTVTNGIVSSLQRTEPGRPNGPYYIGHSATINHGNSGGPLTDMKGRVVGINTWTLNNTQGLFFAIPSSRAAPVVATLIGSNG